MQFFENYLLCKIRIRYEIENYNFYYNISNNNKIIISIFKRHKIKIQVFILVSLFFVWKEITTYFGPVKIEVFIFN